jgi:hypothetical protein
MAYTNININFASGLDTKTDPFQLPVGKFLALNNSVFQKGGLLSKRYGYSLVANAPANSDAAYLTTLNDNLLVLGDTVNALNASDDEFISNGLLQPCSVSTEPLIRNSVEQIQSDSVIANNLCCVTYTQETGSGPTYAYFYAVQDATTGQFIVLPSAIPVLSGGTITGSSRIFVIGNYFVVISQVTVSGTVYLQYFSIPLATPTSPSAAQNVYDEAYVPISSNPGWDAAVGLDGNLVVAYNTTSVGQGVHVTYLTILDIASNVAGSVVYAFTNSAYIGAIVSVCVDNTLFPNPYVYYISFWNNSNTDAYTAAIYITGGVITVLSTPHVVASSVAVVNIASAASSPAGSASGVNVLLEISNTYSFNSQPTNFINWYFVGPTGTVLEHRTPLVRSVGLASKAIYYTPPASATSEAIATLYVLTAFKSLYQPTYFLLNVSATIEYEIPYVVAKLAYQNGGGYVTNGLPAVTITDNTLSFSYLYKQDVIALSTVDNPQQSATGGIYSQLGVNQAFVEIGTQNLNTAEIGQDLLFTGGFLGMFDGTYPVEQNFFLFPETVYVSGSGSGGSITAGTYWYSAVYQWTDSKGNTYQSQPSVPVSVTTSGSSSSVTIYVPTLRITQKASNPVLIVIYRFDATSGAYNQITSVTDPILNSLTSDYVDYVDTEASYVGNNILYTTGGVVPDVNGPASNILTVFDTRLVMVDAEDPNLLWFSKTVVENTPVEMSSDFTVFISPNIGSAVASGPITALYPMDDKLVIFKENSIFYMNGTGPDNLGTTSQGSPLGNYSPPIFITSVIGCTNQQSIVLTPNGLMFQTNKGIWLLGRDLTSSYIGAPVEQYNGSQVTSAQVIPEFNFVLFTLDSGEMLMFDYYYQQWGTWSGPGSVISACLWQGLHTILTSDGLILQQTPGNYVDNATPVLMSFSTSWVNLASLQGYQRFYEMYLLANFLSPHSLIVNVAYDYNPSIAHSSTITPNNYSTNIPGPFGIPTPFGAYPQLEQWRVHAKQQLCQSFQLSIQEVFNSAYGTSPGAGFSMSGLNCKIEIKRSTRPIRGANAVG